MSLSNANFRLNSGTIGLTYPNCNEDPDSLLNWLWDEHGSHNPVYAIVCRERHQSGEYHLHAAIKLGKSLDTINSRFWDWMGHHPNVLRPRNFAQWVSYCKKEGDYRESGSLRGPNQRTVTTPETVISQAISLPKLEFLAWASVNKITYAEKIWDLSHQTTGITIKDGDIFNGIIDPCLQSLKFTLEWLGPKALILVGDSGLGKTTWAKTHIPKPCLFVTHIDELRQFKANYHKSILFDDVSFKHYPIQAQIHLVDFYDPRSIHVRYGIATIPARVHKFFTCNEDPIDLTHPAIARRCKTIRVVRPSFFVDQ